jgi:C1A family cysteine protease
MPIRMVEDDSAEGQGFDPNNDQGNRREQNDAGANSGGGFGSSVFLIPVLGWLLKKPKLLLLAAVLAAAYFFVLKPMMNSDSTIASNKHNAGKGPVQETGAKFDPKKYDSTEVFAPLDNSNIAVPLPERVSLEKYAPTRKNQGTQGSCVAWSSAYAARSILEAASTGIDPNNIAFSPSYLYNQIHLPECQGALLPDAMKTMLVRGSVPLRLFPYDASTCDNMPNNNAHMAASSYKTRGFQRLTISDADPRVDFTAIKQNLAAGAPVVIGMMVPRSFMQGMYGENVWFPEAGEDPDNGSMGGHAMCVIGYDDHLEGGAFQIMNSWGPEWGKNGLGWIRYADFMKFNKEAYGLYPLPAKDAALQRKFECAIGMVSKNKEFFPLRDKGNGVFETTTKIPKNTLFKMYVQNKLECYTYIIGAETDGSAYTLFPYTPKHSPFCGITGVRLFPKDFNMKVDELGTKDYMAVITSKKPIDYKALVAKVNANKNGDFTTRVKAAVGSMAIAQVSYGSDGKTMQFSASAPADNKAVVCVVEINK